MDASVAAKWILDEELSAQARALYAACSSRGEVVAAPPLLPIEVTNVVRQRMRRERLPLPDASRLVRQFLRMPIQLLAPDQLYERALALADGFDLPAAYDAHYVALAQLLACDLWTNDQRLLRALGGRLPSVRWIGAYQGEERV